MTSLCMLAPPRRPYLPLNILYPPLPVDNNSGYFGQLHRRKIGDIRLLLFVQGFRPADNAKFNTQLPLKTPFLLSQDDGPIIS